MENHQKTINSSLVEEIIKVKSERLSNMKTQNTLSPGSAFV